MGAVAIVRTGVANLASVSAGLRRAGARVRLVECPQDVERAERLMLPGVGAFAAGMAALEEQGLVEPLRARIAAGRPTLAVCLGLQVLFEGSEESPGVAGLGAIPGRVRRFPDSLRVPQLGWNDVHPGGCDLLRAGTAYYANSYRVTEAPPDWGVAWTDYGGPFVAAVQRGPVLACQFHPELSASWGASLLERWLS